MPVVIKVRADTQVAQKGFDELGKRLDKAFLLDRAGKALQGVEKAANNLGKAFGETGDKIGDAVGLSIDLGTAGFQVGSAFGPIGGIIGGIAGALVGATASAVKFWSESEEAANSFEAKISDVVIEYQRLVQIGERLSSAALFAAAEKLLTTSVGDIRELPARITAIGDAIDRYRDAVRGVNQQRNPLVAEADALLGRLADFPRSAYGFSRAIEELIDDIDTLYTNRNLLIQSLADEKDLYKIRAAEVTITEYNEAIRRLESRLHDFQEEDFKRRFGIDDESLRKLSAGKEGVKELAAAQRAAASAAAPFLSVLGKMADSAAAAGDAIDGAAVAIDQAATRQRLLSLEFDAAWEQAQRTISAGAALTNEQIHQLWSTAHPILSRLAEAGMMVGDAFGRVAARGVDALFDALQNGSKVSAKGLGEFTVRLLREEGTALIGKGASGLAQAGIMTFIPGLQGNAAGLAGASLAAIGTGLAMGGVAALAGRAAGIRAGDDIAAGGGGRDRDGNSFSGSTGGGRPFETQSLPPLIVNINGVPFGSLSDREAMALAGRHHEIARIYQRNGGGRYLGEERG